MSIIFLTLILASINLSMLGSLVIWRNLSTIGDGLSHALMASIIFEYFFKLNDIISGIIVAISFLLIIEFLRSRSSNSNTHIMILSNFFVAITILLSDITKDKIDLEEYFTGSVYSISVEHFYISLIATIFTISFIYWKLKDIVLMCLSEELAITKGININFLNLIITVLLGVIITLSIRMIGIMLMSSLLIVPAATARLISDSPKKMMLYAVGIAIICSTMSYSINEFYNLSFSSVEAVLLFCLYCSLSIIKATFKDSFKNT